MSDTIEYEVSVFKNRRLLLYKMQHERAWDLHLLFLCIRVIDVRFMN